MESDSNQKLPNEEVVDKSIKPSVFFTCFIIYPVVAGILSWLYMDTGLSLNVFLTHAFLSLFSFLPCFLLSGLIVNIFRRQIKQTFLLIWFSRCILCCVLLSIEINLFVGIHFLSVFWAVGSVCLTFGLVYWLYTRSAKAK